MSIHPRDKLLGPRFVYSMYVTIFDLSSRVDTGCVCPILPFSKCVLRKAKSGPSRYCGLETRILNNERA
jgi:hypothetical protein